jgi:hypothetical protein
MKQRRSRNSYWPLSLQRTTNRQSGIHPRRGGALGTDSRPNVVLARSQPTSGSLVDLRAATGRRDKSLLLIFDFPISFRVLQV